MNEFPRRIEDIAKHSGLKSALTSGALDEDILTMELETAEGETLLELIERAGGIEVVVYPQSKSYRLSLEDLQSAIMTFRSELAQRGGKRRSV